MSVLKAKRSVSKAEFVAKAYEIEKQTLDFARRLSTKNSRIFLNPVVRITMAQAEYAHAANNIFPTNPAEFYLRRSLIDMSIAAVNLLDKRLSLVYETLMLNPQEAFNRQNGRPIDKTTAVDRLDRMAERIGNLIDEQYALLNAVRKSDNDKFGHIITSCNLQPNDYAVIIKQSIALLTRLAI